MVLGTSWGTHWGVEKTKNCSPSPPPPPLKLGSYVCLARRLGFAAWLLHHKLSKPRKICFSSFDGYH